MAANPSLEGVLFSHLLGLFGTPAYVTDRYNRIRGVNRAYAALVGDPLRDGRQGDGLLVHSLIIGPYRDHFPRRYDEVASCTPALMKEIEDGNLQPELQGMIATAIQQDEEAARRVEESLAGYGPDHWDGIVIMKPDEGRAEAFSETVVPLAELSTAQTGPRYLNLWTKAGHPPRSERAEMLLSLTPREREVAVMFARGQNATEISEALGISVHTARDHRDRIYEKLAIHSRAELGRLFDPLRS